MAHGSMTSYLPQRNQVPTYLNTHFKERNFLLIFPRQEKTIRFIKRIQEILLMPVISSKLVILSVNFLNKIDPKKRNKEYAAPFFSNILKNKIIEILSSII